MNVLIYSDEGTSLESVKHTTETLRRHLAPHYAVSTITKDALLSDPWMPYTSLLVIPGGADLPYVRDLGGAGNRRIQQFVRKGGRFLGICAGGYYATAAVEFEQGTDMEVSGPRELRLYAGTARGAVFKGFRYGSDAGARAVEVATDVGGVGRTRLYFNGGSLFTGDAEAEVLARYVGPVEIGDAEASPACVVAKNYGDGRVVLSGAHFEYELDEKAVNARDIDPQVVTRLYEARTTRTTFVRELLRTHLGLTVNDAGVAAVPRLTPLFLSGLAGARPSVAQFEDNMREYGGEIADSNNTFVLSSPKHDYAKDEAKGTHGDGTHGDGAPGEASDGAEGEAGEASDKVVPVYVFRDSLPSPRETPFFNHHVYFAELETAIAQRTTPGTSHLGALLAYGEVVSSTSTLLERNPRLLSRAPNGLVVFGTQQVAGRGRGSNVWVNPVGVMAVSGVLRIPQTQTHQSLVFIQYLSSLALVRAVNSFLHKDIGLRIKWPNDLYLVLDDASHETTSHPANHAAAGTTSIAGDKRVLAKVNGVLVSCHVFSGDFVIVFGSGTNVDNPSPTISLNSRIAQLDAGPVIKIERLLARFLTTFDSMVQQFLVSGFQPFAKEYTNVWLHSNARVFLERYGNIPAIVEGISADSGMLMAVDGNGERYELQPDGNSFDMLRGLIRRKAQP